jgi:diguanylate cyclase (GGDEF)-like protein
MMAQELARQQAQRASLATQLEQASESHALAVEAARTDPLTQLRNRAALAADMAQLIGQNGGAARSFSLLFLDIDHFKEINDRHGHSCGDDVLRQVATLLRTHLRQSDIASRYGGDEFVVLLPGASAETAMRLAERLRSTVEQHRFWSPESTTRLAVTVSVGAAAFPEDGATMDDLILHADASMYTAKRAGRNQTRWLQDRTLIRMDPEQA